MEHKHIPQTSMGDIAFLLLLFFLVFAITTKTVPAVTVSPSDTNTSST